MFSININKVMKMYSDDLIEKVRASYKRKKNYRAVASHFGMHHSTVAYMVNNDYSRLKRKTGPRKKISARQTTKMKLEVKRLQGRHEHVYARKIKNNCDIEASVRTVERALSELGFNYSKVLKQLPLTAKHKKVRVEFARKWIGDNVLSKNVVFSDEKRFSFDGPDNWFSWYDPFDPPLRIKRQLGGGSVMVWGMTLPSGEIYVKRLEGKVNSDLYIAMLKASVVPYLNLRIGQGKYVFQQDNCRVHVSKKTKEYLESAKITTMKWPSYSPDLNIQENIWKMISDEVYDKKQYDSADSLWESIQEAVDVINTRKREKIKKIYDEYGRRLLKVIDNKGEAIDY